MPSRLLFFMVRREILFALRRPLFWIFLLVMVLFTVGYFLGGVRVAVDSGGLGEEEKVHINGPYLLAIFHMAIPFVVATLFAAIAMATTIVRDEELGVEEVLRGTHLSARQYVLGKLVGTGAWVIGSCSSDSWPPSSPTRSRRGSPRRGA
jgi:ABC-type transport system involved in multi-copper enzyme maturation permease subunit